MGIVEFDFTLKEVCDVRRGFLLIWGLATAAIASAAGFFSYQAGWAAAAAAKLPEGAPAYYYDGPHAFGFFGIIPLLFFILLLVFLFRAARWGRGGWGPGGHRGGPGGKSYMEERLQAWHRQAHGEAEPAKPEQPAS